MVEVQMDLVEIKLDFQVHKENRRYSMLILYLILTRTEEKYTYKIIEMFLFSILYLFELMYPMDVLKLVHPHALLHQMYVDQSKIKFSEIFFSVFNLLEKVP